MHKLRSEASALIELGILFLPGIPALIWLWPRLSGTPLNDLAQCLVYVYFFCGALWIGLRRWTWSQLGFSWRGLGLSLVCGGILIAERPIAYLALGLPLGLRLFDLGRIAGEVFFYFVFVSLVEELLFRGLLYQILEAWRGPALAIFGSALCFAVWHIGWAGPLIVAHFFLGVVDGLIRWRAGGIAGLILAHGLYDLVGVEMQAPIAINGINQLLHLTFVNRAAVMLGDALLLGMLLYLWRLYPRFHHN